MFNGHVESWSSDAAVKSDRARVSTIRKQRLNRRSTSAKSMERSGIYYLRIMSTHEVVPDRAYTLFTRVRTLQRGPPCLLCIIAHLNGCSRTHTTLLLDAAYGSLYDAMQTCPCCARTCAVRSAVCVSCGTRPCWLMHRECGIVIRMAHMSSLKRHPIMFCHGVFWCASLHRYLPVKHAALRVYVQQLQTSATRCRVRALLLSRVCRALRGPLYDSRALSCSRWASTQGSAVCFVLPAFTIYVCFSKL